MERWSGNQETKGIIKRMHNELKPFTKYFAYKLHYYWLNWAMQLATLCDLWKTLFVGNLSNSFLIKTVKLISKTSNCFECVTSLSHQHICGREQMVFDVRCMPYCSPGSGPRLSLHVSIFFVWRDVMCASPWHFNQFNLMFFNTHVVLLGEVVCHRLVLVAFGDFSKVFYKYRH